MATTIENQLFTWDGWDQLDTAVFMFYNPVLVIKIGEFEVGHKFEYAVVDYEHSRLVLNEHDNETTEVIFELKLSVGDRVNKDSQK